MPPPTIARWVRSRSKLARLCVGAVGAGVTASVALGSMGGCALDWSFPESGGDSARDDASAPDGAPDGLVAPPDGDSPTRTCTTPDDCRAGTYCRFADHLCGTGLALGTCEPIPNDCVATEFICGCDGTITKSICDANRRRDDVNAATPCAVGDPALFRCGYRYCATKMEFCHVTFVSGIFEYACDAFSGACATNDCACADVTALKCATCTEVVPGAVEVKCR